MHFRRRTKMKTAAPVLTLACLLALSASAADLPNIELPQADLGCAHVKLGGKTLLRVVEEFALEAGALCPFPGKPEPAGVKQFLATAAACGKGSAQAEDLAKMGQSMEAK